ncbi:MAG: ABC transporter permease, partial [Desulfovibrio sp.]|nr:ABC transporter permease [Desulfovibrio sp.]
DENTRKRFFEYENPIGKTLILGKLPCVVIGVLKECYERSMTESLPQSHSVPISFWLAVVFVGLVMFSFSYLSPFMTDNYLFSKNMTPGYAQFMAGAPIERLEPMTLGAAFEQSVLMYKTWCGRFMGNFLVYASFLLPDMLRLALSAMLFVVLCLLIHIHICGLAWKDNLKASLFLLIAAFLWLGMPSFGSAFFWVSVGGMPAIVFQLLFMLPYRFCLDSAGLETLTGGRRYYLFCVLFLMLGMCSASLDYASSAAMPMAALAGIVLYCQRALKRRTLVLLLCGFLGVSVGACLTLLAPGNTCRMAFTTDPEVHAWLGSSLGNRIVEYAFHLPKALLMQWLALCLLIWAIWVLRRAYQASFWRHVPCVTVLFLVPFAATHAAYFFTPWPPERAFATTYVQLFIAASIVARSAESAALAQCAAARRILKICFPLFCAACLCTLCLEAWKFYTVHRITQQRDAIYASHRGEDVRVPALSVQGDSRMVLGYHLKDLDWDPEFWLNRAVAKYWELKSVAIEETPQRSFHMRLSDALGNDCALVLRTDKGRLLVDIAVSSTEEPAYRDLYIYYYGKPAALYLLPQFINDTIAESLNERFPLPQLVPLLFARSTAALIWRRGRDGLYHATGVADLWGISPGTFPFWFVRPGAGSSSLSVRFLADEAHQSAP